MAVVHDALQAFLIDVRDLGSALVHKRKLVWMLGRENLNASAYQLLLDEWKLIAGKNAPLRGFQRDGNFTFVMQEPEDVETWT